MDASVGAQVALEEAMGRTSLRTRLWASLLFVTFIANLPSAFADEIILNALETAVISNGEGESRVLFRTEDWAQAAGVVVSSAVLSIPYDGVVEPDTSGALSFAVEFCPVTVDWDHRSIEWNSDWEYDGRNLVNGTYIREDIDPGRIDGAGLGINFTSILKESMEAGFFPNGFMLAVPRHDGEGLDERKLAIFESLDRATLAIRYKHFSTGDPSKVEHLRH